jgi:hypothetical protein
MQSPHPGVVEGDRKITAGQLGNLHATPPSAIFYGPGTEEAG